MTETTQHVVAVAMAVSVKAQHVALLVATEAHVISLLAQAQVLTQAHAIAVQVHMVHQAMVVAVASAAHAAVASVVVHMVVALAVVRMVVRMVVMVVTDKRDYNYNQTTNN